MFMLIMAWNDTSDCLGCGVEPIDTECFGTLVEAQQAMAVEQARLETDGSTDHVDVYLCAVLYEDAWIGKGKTGGG